MNMVMSRPARTAAWVPTVIRLMDEKKQYMCVRLVNYDNRAYKYFERIKQTMFR